LSSRFNLIVTHEPGSYNYRYALRVLRQVIGEFQVVDSSYSVILLRVSDPYKAVEALRSSGVKPGVIYRVIPVDRVLDPYVEVVAEEARKLAEERIPSDKTYKISIRGRLYWRETRMPAHTMDAIRIIAEGIHRKVSLTSPDYVVYIRSVKFYHRRRYAALAVTEAKNIVSFKSSKL